MLPIRLRASYIRALSQTAEGRREEEKEKENILKYARVFCS